jgi:iron complex transport system ATP-binding protein
MKPIIDAQDVSYEIAGKRILTEVSLALEPGQTTILIGPNGAGKSTLLKLMTGELTPSDGQVTSFGVPLSRMPAWRLACRRAVMAQAQRLNFAFAVHDVVRLGIEGLGRACPPAERNRMVEAALEKADMLALASRDYQTLSGGEQQRVQFARVMCQLAAGRSEDPVQALFLDEPIASLDLCHQLGLMDAAASLGKKDGVAVLAVLHDLNLAARYADRLVAMQNGRIVAHGKPNEVLTDQLLATVFGVENRSDAQLREQFGPFVLPQFCTVATDHASRSAA